VNGLITSLDLAKSLTSGGLEGAEGVMGIPGDMRLAATSALEGATGYRLPDVPDYAKALPALKSSGDYLAPLQASGFMHQAQNEPERIAERLGAYAPFALAPGGPLERLAAVVLPAIAPTTQGMVDNRPNPIAIGPEQSPTDWLHALNSLDLGLPALTALTPAAAAQRLAALY